MTPGCFHHREQGTRIRTPRSSPTISNQQLPAWASKGLGWHTFRLSDKSWLAAAISRTITHQGPHVSCRYFDSHECVRQNRIEGIAGWERASDQATALGRCFEWNQIRALHKRWPGPIASMTH